MQCNYMSLIQDELIFESSGEAIVPFQCFFLGGLTAWSGEAAAAFLT